MRGETGESQVTVLQAKRIHEWGRCVEVHPAVAQQQEAGGRMAPRAAGQEPLRPAGACIREEHGLAA
jgi:hypothetical protein